MEQERREEQEAGLFEVRSYLGRTVYIIDNIIQPDFSVEEIEDIIA